MVKTAGPQEGAPSVPSTADYKEKVMPGGGQAEVEQEKSQHYRPQQSAGSKAQYCGQTDAAVALSIYPGRPKAVGYPKKHVVVNVECRMKPESTEHLSHVQHRVETFLHATLVDVKPDTDVSLATNYTESSKQRASGDLLAYLHEHVCNVRICEADGADTGRGVLQSYPLSLVTFRVHVYQPQEEGAVEETSEENLLMANHWILPSVHLEGLWDTLFFDDEIQLRLLGYVSATMLFSDKGVDPNVIAWNRVILLHGPAGTGKTSLCRALAQKLSIRLGRRYAYGKLVEINSYSLFSKWFSESGKLVQRMFSQIRDLVADEDAMVCVLIDEVESLAAARVSAASGSDPSDAIRVVNSLLTQIDQLKQQKNVLILATSNITQAIDVAFVDRADIKQYIGLPNERATFKILGSCIEELIRVGIITDVGSKHLFNCSDEQAPTNDTNMDASMRLRSLSRCCQGMSGRTLRKMPFLAHALHLRHAHLSSLNDFMDALERTIGEEKVAIKQLETSAVHRDLVS